MKKPFCNLRGATWRVAACAVLLPALAGCLKAEPARFVLNFQGREPGFATREQQQVLVDSLTALFGTPDEPYLFADTGLDLDKLKMAAGPTERIGSDLGPGARHGLFRQHCVHCHGVTGDGDGPTALFLDPYPRDYRRGIFKFTSTGQGLKPTTADLKRTLMDGIPGTSMPSFALLPEDEVDALVEYVKYLSIRGETELLLQDLLINQEEELTPDALKENMEPIVAQWQAAEEGVLVPETRPAIDTPDLLAASIEAGRKLFLDEKRAQCVKCHGPTGLGDGGEVIFDDWNLPKFEELKKGVSPAVVAEMWSLPLQSLKPRNLRLGIYRGGRRPLDLYRRISVGIKGAKMPGAGPGPGNAGVLKPEEIWTLVDFVRSLPYQENSNPFWSETHVVRAGN